MVVPRLLRLLATALAIVIGAALLADVVVGNPLASFAFLVNGARATGHVTATEQDVYEPDSGPSEVFYHVSYRFETEEGKEYFGRTKSPTDPLEGVDTETGPLPTVEVEYERANPENNREFGEGPASLWQWLVAVTIFVVVVGVGFRAARDHFKEGTDALRSTMPTVEEARTDRIWLLAWGFALVAAVAGLGPRVPPTTVACFAAFGLIFLCMRREALLSATADSQGATITAYRWASLRALIGFAALTLCLYSSKSSSEQAVASTWGSLLSLTTGVGAMAVATFWTRHIAEGGAPTSRFLPGNVGWLSLEVVRLGRLVSFLFGAYLLQQGEVNITSLGLLLLSPALTAAIFAAFETI